MMDVWCEDVAREFADKQQARRRQQDIDLVTMGLDDFCDSLDSADRDVWDAWCRIRERLNELPAGVAK